MSEIDDLLQAKLEALEGGERLEKVLTDLPPEAEELVTLVKLASAVRELAHPQTSLNGSTARQLVSAARQHKNHRSQPQLAFNWLRPALATMAVIGAVVLLLAGGFWLVGPRNAQAAVAMDIVGSVEVAANDTSTSWKLLREGDAVRSGQRIRTGAASGATLVFFEGSRATLSANADVTLATLDGSWDRTLSVVFNQHSGETSHSVVPLRGKESKYQVQTPSGIASVHGTVFSVAVNKDGKARFAVDTGKVLVSGQNTEVMLVAGEATAAEPGQATLQTGYQFELKGILSGMVGDVWTVNGVSFKVTSGTSIDGDPQPGDFVSVEGRVSEGEWLADKVEVTRPNEAKNGFTGILEDNDGDTWVVSGVELLITSDTKVDDDLMLGDSVEVKFMIVGEDWVAVSIDSLVEKLDETPVASETITVTETVTPTTTVTPTVTITPTGTVTPTLVTDCVGANPHPTGQKLAARYGVSYEEIMGWFCQRFGFGEIDLAYELSRDSGVPVADIFAMKSGGMGWGNIKKAVRNGMITPTPPVTTTVTVEPGNSNKPDKPNPKPPKDKPNNNGNNKKNATCPGPGTNPTGIALANRYGASYDQIMSWYCQGMNWKQIERRLGGNLKKSPRP